MNNGSYIAEIAALLGDPARANMLSALMDGGALSAGDLAFAAHVTAQTTSAHLAKLVEAQLLACEKRGRHRYFRLASAEVARMLEEIMSVAVTRTPRYRPGWMRDEALRSARTCYDHLAGRLGVALTESLVARQYVLLDEDGGAVTEKGAQFFSELGLELPGIGKRRRFCRPCVDWSERRPHLGGAVGAALAQYCFSAGSSASRIAEPWRSPPWAAPVSLSNLSAVRRSPKCSRLPSRAPACKTCKCGRYRRR
jgi:DNA-binding transcriptional ArsR family regulator